MKLSERFIGKGQWTLFFLVSFFVSMILMSVFLLVIGINFFVALLLGFLVFLGISIYALVKAYMFFYNAYPDCKDMERRRFFSVPEKHAALVEINGVYPEKPLHAGWYLVFPFFKFVTFSQVIFLGDFNGIIFDGSPENKVDFKNGISTPVEAMYVAHLYSGPELGTDLRAGDSDTEDIVSILASMLDKKKTEIRSLGLVTRELKSLILDNSIKRYAKEENADSNIREMLMSLLRLTLGSMDSDTARGDKIDLAKLKKEDICVFNSIIKHYGVDICSVNILDIVLSDEEIEINRTEYKSKMDIKVAENKKEVAIIEAKA
ncbi:MAG: hypothetical protein WCY43_02730, partial [Patescibacteria group bacterium]